MQELRGCPAGIPSEGGVALTLPAALQGSLSAHNATGGPMTPVVAGEIPPKQIQGFWMALRDA